MAEGMRFIRKNGKIIPIRDGNPRGVTNKQVKSGYAALKKDRKAEDSYEARQNKSANEGFKAGALGGLVGFGMVGGIKAGLLGALGTGIVGAAVGRLSSKKKNTAILNKRKKAIWGTSV